MASFYVENFGCRSARADGEAIASSLSSEGLTEAAHAQAAVVIVNTCSVTAEADRDARSFIRKTRRLNPQAKVVVTGCYAQRAPEEIASLDGVSAVVGNSHKGLAPKIVLSLAQESLPNREFPSNPAPTGALLPATTLLTGSGTAKIWADDRFAHSYIEEAQVAPNFESGFGHGTQTRPNLKIQEGCGNRCTFCVIPTTRGASRSLAPEKVLAQVRGFVAAGGNELVLSGINLGQWGRDLAKNRILPDPSSAISLSALLREILEKTALPRLRLSSIEPMDWTPELIDLLREFGGSRLARHAHLPLQSGSDAVLRRMHRRYRPWHYAQKVASLLAAAGPELCLGADVMAGFPGESDAEFRETCDFIAAQPFAYLHLFPFSPRPGTCGWELHRQTPVPAEAVRERMAALKELAAQNSHKFRSTFVGRTLPAITLHASPANAAQGKTPALTDNFLHVELPQALEPNQLVQVDIVQVNPDGTLLAENSAPGLKSPSFSTR